MSGSGTSGGRNPGETLDDDELKTYVQDVMGWTTYQAQAYVAVVQHEPIEPNEIVALTDVPQGRVYDVMRELEGTAVNIQARQPKKYQAQHPRSLLGDKKDEFNDKADSAISHLEQQHEIQRESATPRHPAWIIPGIAGTKREIREAIKNAEDSIRMVEQDGKWIQSNEIRDFGRLVNQGITVEAIGCPRWSAKLEEFVDGAEISAWLHDQVDSSFIFIDDELVLMRAGEGDTGVKIEDHGTVNVLQKAYDSLKEEAADVQTHA